MYKKGIMHLHLTFVLIFFVSPVCFCFILGDYGSDSDNGPAPTPSMPIVTSKPTDADVTIEPTSSPVQPSPGKKRERCSEYGIFKSNHFKPVVLMYTSFKPEKVLAVMDASDTESVASCSANRYSIDNFGEPILQCDEFYVSEDCVSNEDILPPPPSDVCITARTSAMPRTKTLSDTNRIFAKSGKSTSAKSGKLFSNSSSKSGKTAKIFKNPAKIDVTTRKSQLSHLFGHTSESVPLAQQSPEKSKNSGEKVPTLFLSSFLVTSLVSIVATFYL